MLSEQSPNPLVDSSCEHILGPDSLQEDLTIVEPCLSSTGEQNQEGTTLSWMEGFDTSDETMSAPHCLGAMFPLSPPTSLLANEEDRESPRTQVPYVSDQPQEPLQQSPNLVPVDRAMPIEEPSKATTKTSFRCPQCCKYFTERHKYK